MPTILDYYEFAKLATASYVKLDVGLSGSQVAGAANTQERLPLALARQTFVDGSDSDLRGLAIQHFSLKALPSDQESGSDLRKTLI